MMGGAVGQPLGGGPLAYLERTTSNIGTVAAAAAGGGGGGGHPLGGVPPGPPDGRR